MKHKIGYNRLGRKPAHRKALERSMVTSLFRHERIRTTGPKAKELRRKAEKLITRAKVDSVHNRRIASQVVKDRTVLAKLFTDIAPRYIKRSGGYTRILKLGRRIGDAAEIVLLELVEETLRTDEAPKSRKKKSAVTKKSRETGKKGSEPEKAKSEPVKAESAADRADSEESATAAAATVETAADETSAGESAADEPDKTEANAGEGGGAETDSATGAEDETGAEDSGESKSEK